MNKARKIISIVAAIALTAAPSLKSEQVIAAPACENVPECGVNGIIVGSQIIGGILYYLVKSGTGAVHKVRSKESTPPAHRTNQSDESEFSITTKSTACQELADRKTAETGKKWVVAGNKPVRGTGPLNRPGQLFQWECTIRPAREGE